jgi:predicted transposase/invertase (TIGR01784 family)
MGYDGIGSIWTVRTAAAKSFRPFHYFIIAIGRLRRLLPEEKIMSEENRNDRCEASQKDAQSTASETKKPLLLPRYDRVFKRIFGAKRNADILRSLLSAVLDLPQDALKTIAIDDPNLRMENRFANKGPVLDLKLTLADGTSIDIELQVGRMPEMKERIIFCTSKLVTEQIGAGESYGNLRRVVTIVITHFDLTESPDDYFHRFHFYDKKRDRLFTKSVEINILEVKKLPKREDGTPLWIWGRFFGAETEEEFDMLAEKNAEVEKAVVIIKRLSGSERERRIAEMQEMARRDEESVRRGMYIEGRAEGRAEGHAEGRAEGMEIGKVSGYERAKSEELAMELAIAAKLLREGVPPDVVARSFGLSRDAIERL